jgi:hypothetical protein
MCSFSGRHYRFVDWGGVMPEPVEITVEGRAAEGADVQTLMNLAGPRDLKLGRLFLLVFVINVAAGMFAWPLIRLIEWMTFGK